MPNKLIDEQSPYLQQHAHNPVGWYPWGDEAFELAKKENKPVLVSIGYAACHWCHVMERESFEDDATAAYMNKHFVNIKVDREEHPDVDHMYMDAVQAITGSGGWPLNVFVTHDRMPFYGGTYYPPQSMYNRPSWLQVLQNIYQVWTEKPEDVQQQTAQMTQYLQQLSEVAIQSDSKWQVEHTHQVAATLLANADKQYGGFGKAPKFPATMSIKYLLEYYQYSNDEQSLQHAVKSLDALIEGGIYDQLGGGLARYSTDDYWLAPHFEKMLYDNALLITVLSDAYAITKYDRYKLAIEQTIAFVNREMQHEKGGFYSALDADSEGVEGKFYTWTWSEWSAVVEDNKIAQSYFGVTFQGNWEGTNILHVTKSFDEVAIEFNVSKQHVEEMIETVKEKLLKERNKRVRPQTDDKSLLSWNALMNTALSKAGKALNKAEFLQQAQVHMQWMLDAYYVDGEWMHTYKDSIARINAKLDDLAYLVEALIQLASNTRNNKWLQPAIEIISVTQDEYLHRNKNFYYYSAVSQKDIPVRKTDLYDNALPSANSVMANNLIVLGMLIGSYQYIEQGQFMLQKMQSAAVRYAGSFANWALFAQRNLKGMKIAILSGEDVSAYQDVLDGINSPEVVVFNAEGEMNNLVGLHKNSPENGAMAYICDTEKCSPPINDPDKLKKMLIEGS